MAAISADEPLDIYGCGFDFLRAQLRSTPRHAAGLAERLIALCPEMSAPGDTARGVAALAQELEETRRFTCWWD
jgi:hypothetical protein